MSCHVEHGVCSRHTANNPDCDHARPAKKSEPMRCESGHLMSPNPTPGMGRPGFVHRWPQELAEHGSDGAR